MKFQDLTLNWFDLVTVAVIAVGAFRGRSRGMSVELFDVLKWLMIVVIGGLVYQPVGRVIADYTHLSVLFGFVAAYLFVLLFIRFFFGYAKRMMGEKLVGGDVFGGGEYYLGMLAGSVRFLCVLIVVLALLNAKYITPEQLAAERKMQTDNFGDISFPTLGSIQQTVFSGSVSGRLAKMYLSRELIVTREADYRTASADTLARRRERALNDIIGDK